MGERELASLCSRMDGPALEELYRRYAAKVLALCLRYVNDDRDEAEDLMHDTMLKVIKGMGRFSFRGDGSLYAWIRGIAINLAIDRIRRNSILNLSPLEEETLELPEALTESVEEIPTDVLSGMISELPGIQRLIVHLYCVDGYSHKEIAHMLGIKMKTSSSLLAKAKKLLNKKVERYLHPRIRI